MGGGAGPVFVFGRPRVKGGKAGVFKRGGSLFGLVRPDASSFVNLPRISGFVILLALSLSQPISRKLPKVLWDTNKGFSE